MNHIALSGNLTADIESRPVNDKTVCKFTVAVNDREDTLFLPVEAWNMDHLPRFLHKGSKVIVEGGLRQNEWTTKEGEKRSRLFLAAHRVEFLDPAPARSNPQADSAPASRPTPAPQSKSRRVPANAF